MMYTCSYFIEILSQFRNSNNNYGIRCYFQDLKIGQAINMSSTIDITILESQLKESPTWGEGTLKYIVPVANDLVRIYIHDGEKFELVIAGLIDKISYNYANKIYSIGVNDLQDIGTEKTAKFFSKSNIIDDINDYKKIQYLYKLKLGNSEIDEVGNIKKITELTKNVDFDIKILNADELKKTKYGFELRGSDTFGALIKNTLLKHNLHQFCNYSIDNNITKAKIILNKKPNILNFDNNTFFEINLDLGSDFLISYDIGNMHEAKSKPQVIQKHYYFSYRTSEEDKSNSRYYIFSDPFFNLGGAEGKISMDSYSISGYFETSEWKKIKDEVKNYTDVKDFVKAFREKFKKAKDFLNQVAFRELMSDLYDTFKIKITLFGGHKVDESFLTPLGQSNKDLSKLWRVGLAVNFTAKDFGYENKKMVITEVMQGNVSNPNGQSITLTLVNEDLLGKYNDKSYYTFPNEIKEASPLGYDIAPILELLNENDKAFDFFNKSNQVINKIINKMRSVDKINDEKYQTQRDLLSPQLRKIFKSTTI